MGAVRVYVSMGFGLMALFLVMIYLWCTEAMAQDTTQQLEVQQLLKRLNKPAVKSIKSPDGDIIDCVHISHQPAFDHPSLKNHTIQMRPSLLPSGLYDENEESSSIPQLWHQNGRCPEDTIPIRRTRKEDVLRASSVERYGKKSPGTIPNATPPIVLTKGREFAGVFANSGKYYGAKAIINAWNPMVEDPYEFSASELWLIAGPLPQLNMVQVGWHVYPILYGDNRTRLFTLWMNGTDALSAGCYNLGCSGFIQVNKDIALGAVISPISSYGGLQYEITLFIFKDPKSGNWWLQYGNLPPLGYWPSSLFRYLSDSASLIQWGGEVENQKLKDGQHTTTKMGSGHFSGEGSGKASYFRGIQIVDQSNDLQDPQGIGDFITSPTCYDVHHAGKGYIYYGGPGRNPNCP